jgi:chemotaxis protein methyltransferase CheR
MTMATATMTPVDIDYVRTLVKEQSAIVLEQAKAYLIESRLEPVARKAGAANAHDLVSQLRAKPYSKLHHQVVEAMTTNETSWFRDIAPFAALRDHLLPELIAHHATDRRITIWSAASSTGQEIYSIAMLLADHFPQLRSGWQVKLLASDLSEEVVDRAKSGKFTPLEVNRGLPAPMLVKHFERVGSLWQVKPELRNQVSFGVVNLIKPWPQMPPLDIVMLRNVMIYFDVETKKQILANVRRVLRPGGHLFLGNAETTLNLDERFERVQYGKATCYRVAGR